MSKKLFIPLQIFCKGIFFYILIIFTGCHEKKDDPLKNISVTWKDSRATAISISKSSLENISTDSLHTQFEVRLAKSESQSSIPGSYTIKDDEIIFEPLLPFTRGLRYRVYVQHKIYGEIEIPKDTTVPKLLAIYPGGDSLPENLLKIYLVFSQPMVEGHSLKYIALLNDKGDSLQNTFLNLQSELWNRESTILTLWLDPGRIKRDLQPNKLLGPPLTRNKHYTLVIARQWPDQQGTTLQKPYTKSFVATVPDSVSPSRAKWKLNIPTSDTKQPLEVQLGEQLDHILLLNTITIIDADGNIIEGEKKISVGATSYFFTPAKPWPRGLYKLQIESRLEDLAGNNLNRLFDLDLKKDTVVQRPKKVVEREWRIN